MPRNRKLCFVIADGGHARFVRPAIDFSLHTFEAVGSVTLHKRDRDLVSDRPGRSFESGSVSRHAYTPRGDPHEMEKDRFAQAVAKRINDDFAENVFNEIVLVAPARVMSELAGGLDGPASSKLVGRLAKDLVKTPDHELWPHLKEWVRPVHRA